MSMLSPLRQSLFSCRRLSSSIFIAGISRRNLFSLPDLSKCSPLPGQNKPDADDPHTYHERKILPCVPYYVTEIEPTKYGHSLRYSPSQMYKVVSDVASYPRFLPFCTGTRILSTTLPKDPLALGLAGTLRMEAEMTVGFMAFKESYVSKVTCVPYESVEVRNGSRQTVRRRASFDVCSCRPLQLPPLRSLSIFQPPGDFNRHLLSRPIRPMPCRTQLLRQPIRSMRHNQTNQQRKSQR